MFYDAVWCFLCVRNFTKIQLFEEPYEEDFTVWAIGTENVSVWAKSQITELVSNRGRIWEEALWLPNLGS